MTEAPTPAESPTPLDIARAQVGITEVPKGSNRGPPHDLYALPGEDPLPWCARFLRFCFRVAGTPLPGHPYLIGRVETLQDALAKRGAILPGDATIEPGDIIFYRDRGKSDQHKGGRHIGIVESAGATTLVTVEGNWSDAVVRRTDVNRYGKDVWCFARWPVEGLG